MKIKENQIKEDIEDNQENSSICEIMKENTSEVIKKIESQIPLLFQNYSNLYTQYLHTLDDIFGTCYVAEKEFFDKLNVEQDILEQIKKNSESIKNNYIQNIEITSKLLDQYTKIRIEAIRSFDSYFHMMVDSYAKSFSQSDKSQSTNSNKQTEKEKI